jgi:hypothetical protein
MVTVTLKASYYNDTGDSGVVRGQRSLQGVPHVGEKVQLRDGGLFYTVQDVLWAYSGKVTCSLGSHNLSSTTVGRLMVEGFTRLDN